MAHKHHQGLRDEVRASLQGISELAAELDLPPAGDVPCDQDSNTVQMAAAQPNRILAGVGVATIPPRPWTPAAAQEPIPPLAPPPSRPFMPVPGSPLPRLPADGGKKMNILPIIVIGVLVILLTATIFVLIHHA